MKWYNYVACFFSGVFLINSLPHFMHGIDGEAFPTPFAQSVHHGLSSPLVNIIWASTNLLVGILLLRAGKVSLSVKWSVGLFFCGVVVFSVVLSLMAPTVLAYYKSAH